ncbi:hypothetical protein [Streptomyces sp. NPDC056683]|uniref:hypothetical protein n=1 Tax=Streptomyces sp. NPDC056683 TaxID=3345910 RepID=UPI0036987F01
MRPDSWHLTEDVDEFLAEAGDFLRSRPAPHSVVLTVTEKLRTRGVDPHGGVQTPALGRLEQAGEGDATFYRLPFRGQGVSTSLQNISPISSTPPKPTATSSPSTWGGRGPLGRVSSRDQAVRVRSLIQIMEAGR